MTVLDMPRPTTERTPESQNLAQLRAMLTDEAERDHWPEIQRAIDYLTAASTPGA